MNESHFFIFPYRKETEEKREKKGAVAITTKKRFQNGLRVVHT